MRGVLDAIYWRLHTSFLKNQREDAARFLSMMEDEIGAGTAALEDEVGRIHRQRYEIIREKMSLGQFGRLYGYGASISDFDLSLPSKEKSGEERAFCRELLKSRDRLLSALDIEFYSLVAPEVPMQPYGRCDFTIREGRTFHVVEVKMGEAPTSVTSQIDKYRLAAELDMCLGLYDTVQAFVLAESFPPYVVGELSRAGVHMVEHRGTVHSLRSIG